MDHPFWTRRFEMQRALEGLALLADVVTLASMTRADQAKVLARREPEVDDEAVRGILQRRGGRLGLLLEDVDACGTGSALAKAHGTAWAAFLAGGDEPTELVAAAEAVRADLVRVRDETQAVELDAGSSSYSDYSDSRTVSSDEESGEESEEEEDDTPPRKR